MSISVSDGKYNLIAIVNMGPHDDPDKGGERVYEVRINDMVICTFKHRRADGLGRCLLEASKAVEMKKWEDFMLGCSGPQSPPPDQISPDGTRAG